MRSVVDLPDVPAVLVGCDAEEHADDSVDGDEAGTGQDLVVDPETVPVPLAEPLPVVQGQRHTAETQHAVKQTTTRYRPLVAYVGHTLTTLG